MRISLVATVALSSVLASGCGKKDEDTGKAPSATETPSPASETPPPATAATPVAGAKATEAQLAAIAKIFAGDKPSKASPILPALTLGMKDADAEALWNKHKATLKTPNFEVGWTSSDDETVDQIAYMKLPTNGVVALGNKTWGEALPDTAGAAREAYPVKRDCWFNPAEGVRACARQDEGGRSTGLKISRYLAAETFVKDGLFVFEGGSSLLGKDIKGLEAQLLRSDDLKEKQSVFIPPTMFEDTNKLDFDFGANRQASVFKFNLRFTDDAHRDALLAGLSAGLGKGTLQADTWTHESAKRTISVRVFDDSLAVSVK